MDQQPPQQRRRRYNPTPEPNNKKSDKLLNIAIAVVSILIVIVGYFVLTYDGSDQQTTEQKTEQKETNSRTEDVQKEQEQAKKEQAQQRAEDAQKDITERSTVTQSESSDANVEMTIVDSTWKPTKTTQTENIGEGHVSAYDGTSVDWQEKVTTLATVTNIPEDTMKIIRVKNGGANDRTIGIVTTVDGAKKYRVTLQWVADKGWKAEQIDVLKTLEGTY
ncbi:YrrS family protein [Kurthia huakuii]|uniref:YrrS family protein n=1 Tax=Kurthia huakuii TaxID=1421019 RepID=UPI000496945A|nr:YrrS family protein [Kurthia huakuii]MBM7697935.1 hypothetical protein [Kurthia huakuii]